MSAPTIVELLGLTPAEGALGVEIEVEGEKLPSSLGKYWRVDHDGSLRGESHEYVMPKPESIEKTKEALEFLRKSYASHGSKVHDSIRAGVHVHRNVQKLNVKQLYTFIICYFLLEDVLVKWCGDAREGNHFCLRAKDAEYVLFMLCKTIENRKLKTLNTTTLRYCSLNVCSLFKYGSIEFRAMRGTGDLDTIFAWVQTIEDIYQMALTFDSPIEVYENVNGTENEFLKYMLPNTYHHYYKTPGLVDMIEEATRRIRMLVYAIDWNDFDKPAKNPFI